MIIEPTVAREMWAHPDFAATCEEYATYANKALPKPIYRREIYEAMESSGSLLGFRAMEGDNLAGFMTIVTAVVPHLGIQISVVESLFVRSEYRKTYAGIRLINTAEEYGRNVNSLGVIINCPAAEFILQELLRILGYTPMTINFYKSLCPQ